MANVPGGPRAKRARPTTTDDVVMGEPGSAHGKKGKTGGMNLTVQEIAQDKLTQVAQEHWSLAAQGSKERPAFSAELVERIYKEELGGGSEKAPSLKRIILLEISQYLENYLWPNFDAEASSNAHVMSIVLMVNEKFRETVPAWTCFQTRKDVFPSLMQRVLSLRASQDLTMHEKTSYLLFAINIFQSLEDEMVRPAVLRLVSLPLWHALSPGRLQLELHAHPQLAKHWRHAAKKEAKAAGKPGHVPAAQRPDTTFLPALLGDFLEQLQRVVGSSTAATAATAATVAPAPNNRAPASANGTAPSAPPPIHAGALLFCERFVEFMVDLLSQLPTRRFVRTVLEDRAVLVKCKLSALYRHPDGRLFRQLVDLLQFYLSFPIDDHTGEPLTEDDVSKAHYDKICQLQRLAFKHVPKLRELALSNCGTVEKHDTLRKHLSALSEDELRFLATRQLRLVAEDDPWAADTKFLQEVMLTTYERRRFQREVINEMPLYPTETLMWDPNMIPDVHYTGATPLALPKLNLQFLTPHDYLLRNFNLFRLEATYEIREDVQDVLTRVGARYDLDDKVVFSGWARMALPLAAFKITEVRKPAVGEFKPAGVTAEVVIDTRTLRGDVRSEWDEVKQHDVMFLLSVRPPDQAALAEMRAAGQEPSVPEQHGLLHVRGCEVVEVRDEGGALMNDFTGRVKPEDRKLPEGFQRTIVVALDTAQYQMDINYMVHHKTEDLYGTFNLLVRRKPKENNFKAVLESIRDLMNEEVIIPPWLHDIFLGYGDPGAAQYTAMPEDTQLRTVDFKDTFLDAQHVRDSFPQYEVEFAVSGSGGGAGGVDGGAAANGAPQEHQLVPPFRVTYPDAAERRPAPGSTLTGDGAHAVATAAPSTAANGTAEARNSGEASTSGAAPTTSTALTTVSRPRLRVEAYTPPNPGPYPQDQPRRNHVRFTPVQVEAITSGVQPGLTMVVGPPGTGKTDTAVQIMHVLYHNCPGQRTLLITHSNQALNDLFQKIMERDVPARYLLRLGMGERELETDDDFSRVGRVNAMLARRLELLAEVEKMAKQFGVQEDVAYTCETAAHFWLLHVLSRWEKFQAAADRVGPQGSPDAVRELFPFAEYFASAPQPLFGGVSYEADMEVARGCFRHLKTMFQELEECRAFELLKGQGDRVNYLMTKQAKIVAMTCTHAALKRREFVQLAFQYDNLLMEEAGQILEIETFIPMLLQRQEDGVARLKRVVLIGDHHQLPPVVKNMAFQKYAHMDQPLFTRFIRLGTPYVELNAQGRARPQLAALYNWRYRSLGDLPAVRTEERFVLANPGFAFEYQFVDVPDLNGVGETEPVPYFYQNLAEAEYLVSCYCFMRLMGYPAEKISILTTYNGQKALLRDVLERRCAHHPLFGRPHKVATVDKYQGQQNDYILLSLVRTRLVGHLRDVRRLVVAMSRARLGLYIFGRQSLFANCFELQPTFRQLLQRPTQLALVKHEAYGQCARRVGGGPAGLAAAVVQPVSGVMEMAGLVERIAQEQMQNAAAATAAARAAQRLKPQPPSGPPPVSQPPAAAAVTQPSASEATEADVQPSEVPAAAVEAATDGEQLEQQQPQQPQPPSEQQQDGMDAEPTDGQAAEGAQ